MVLTGYQDAILRPAEPGFGTLFPARREEFVIRGVNAIIPPIAAVTNELAMTATTGLAEQERFTHSDPLVRLPSIRESEWRVTVLQGWVGRVSEVRAKDFVAILTDATKLANPPERVELDVSEISDSDIALLADGAIFYWSIGYRDTPGGQRERISTLRLARQPKIGQAELRRTFQEADRLADTLESD